MTTANSIPNPKSTPIPILVVGNVVLDVILNVDHYPHEDEEMRALSRRTDLGGNAANTARVLAALGHPVTLLATLAPDAHGSELRRLLAEAGVDTGHLVTAGSGHTPLSMILVHEANGSRTIVHHRELAELGFEHFRGLPLGRYGWVHFEGRNIEAVAPMMEHLAGIAFRGRVSVEIEKVRPGIEGLVGRADLVLSCRAYAQANGFKDAPALLSYLHRHGNRALMTCTWGEAGAWALEADGQQHHCPAFMPPRVVDTVGAGDAFNAGMVHALTMGADTPHALKIATRLAGRKVSQAGFVMHG